ncbi:hypothetical protein DSO57_1017095 [Entomophthora muscae]|uniref:Uncharacterized protein n=1 Tax=Entomophthora muscae TaxID=34485 RepID=A0ACC2TGJ8_9FUNG|nr:hypothetical protein DSO57_1017095 [Entomophthora muscae]
MVMVPIGSVITGLNLGALARKIGDLFPLKWVPEKISCCVSVPRLRTQKVVLTTGAASPLTIPFDATFSGLSSPLLQEFSSPEITSPPIKEDISDPPIILTVLNL